MTYSKLMGGIGNQLFQVAAGYAYSEKHNTAFYIDSSEWVGSQGKNGMEYKDSVFKNFKFNNFYPRSTILYTEVQYNYTEIERLKLDKYCLILSGYFQSLKYFEEVQDEFKELLVLPNVNTAFIGEKNVAFHIRRGDYLHYKDVHYVCDTEYFDKCFEEFKGYQINVFTDSPTFVLEEFKHQKFNLIQTSSEISDLTLISLHDNVVCSNSSFSWWASFLGKPKDRIIVPSKWFAGNQNTSDIYRPEFIKIDV